MKKINYILVLVMAMFISACSPTIKDVTSNFILPYELQEDGCKIHQLYDGFRLIYVVQCETKKCTSTAYNHGKVSNYSAMCE